MQGLLGNPSRTPPIILKGVCITVVGADDILRVAVWVTKEFAGVGRHACSGQRAPQLASTRAGVCLLDVHHGQKDAHLLQCFFPLLSSVVLVLVFGWSVACVHIASFCTGELFEQHPDDKDDVAAAATLPEGPLELVVQVVLLGVLGDPPC